MKRIDNIKLKSIAGCLSMTAHPIEIILYNNIHK